MKTLQQIIDEEREKSGIKELTNQQIAVIVTNTDRYRSDDEKKQIAASNKQFRQQNPYTEERKARIGAAMRGKSLEEILGSKERAAEGRKKRSEAHLGKQRPLEVGKNIAAGRRAAGSYDGRSMRGKEHKESTKEMMAIKARARQDLKRELGLGRSDKVDKTLLEERYILLGLQ